MYIAARLKDGFIDEVLKQCASCIYEIDDDDDVLNLLTPLSFDSEQQSLNQTCNLQASAVIRGWELYFLLQFSDNSIMVCFCEKAIVVDLDTMDQQKTINIKDKCIPRI